MSNHTPKMDTPGIILAKIFRTLLFELGVNIDRYQYFMCNFIKQLDLNNNYKISSLINNLSKEVFHDSVSWKVFIKALLFLGTTKFTIFIKINEEADIVYHTVDIADKSVANNLFCFSGSEENDEEVKLGKHLKDFLTAVVVKNSMKLEYSEAIADYIEYLKSIRRFSNKSLKGNLTKELRKDNISWKVFIKGLIVYGITSPVIGVTIYDRSGKHHTVSFGVNLDDGML